VQPTSAAPASSVQRQVGDENVQTYVQRVEGDEELPEEESVAQPYVQRVEEDEELAE
jgi:hypothetical protein